MAHWPSFIPIAWHYLQSAQYITKLHRLHRSGLRNGLMVQMRGNLTMRSFHHKTLINVPLKLQNYSNDISVTTFDQGSRKRPDIVDILFVCCCQTTKGGKLSANWTAGAIFFLFVFTYDAAKNIKNKRATFYLVDVYESVSSISHSFHLNIHWLLISIKGDHHQWYTLKDANMFSLLKHNILR